MITVRAYRDSQIRPSPPTWEESRALDVGNKGGSAKAARCYANNNSDGPQRDGQDRKGSEYPHARGYAPDVSRMRPTGVSSYSTNQRPSGSPASRTRLRVRSAFSKNSAEWSRPCPSRKPNPSFDLTRTTEPNARVSPACSLSGGRVLGTDGAWARAARDQRTPVARTMRTNAARLLKQRVNIGGASHRGSASSQSKHRHTQPPAAPARSHANPCDTATRCRTRPTRAARGAGVLRRTE